MRGRNQGTWDRTTGSWRIKKKKIQKSPKQLEEIFGEPVPKSKEGSRPYWNRYLAVLHQQANITKRKTSPLQTRIASLEVLIEQFEQEKRPCDDLKAELQRCLDVPAHDIDNADFPAPHPNTMTNLQLLGLEGDELAVRIFSSLQPKPVPKKESLRAEVDAYVARKKGKDKYTVRTALELFLKATGEIRIADIKVEHYRKFLDLLSVHPTWNDTSRAKQQGRVHSFLKKVEADYNLIFGFIRNKDYILPMPDGDKVQWPHDQVRDAMKLATGIPRTALLLGLNCGFYASDITSLVPGMFDGKYIKRGRKKNDHKKTKLVASWKIWKETQAALQFGITSRDLQREWTKFQKAHDFPEHKALRKTVAQIIQDHVGEEESRLYRCEKGEGTHHKSYIIPYTPEQVAKLDKALAFVENFLFGSS